MRSTVSPAVVAVAAVDARQSVHRAVHLDVNHVLEVLRKRPTRTRTRYVLILWISEHHAIVLALWDVGYGQNSKWAHE